MWRKAGNLMQGRTHHAAIRIEDTIMIIGGCIGKKSYKYFLGWGNRWGSCRLSDSFFWPSWDMQLWFIGCWKNLFATQYRDCLQKLSFQNWYHQQPSKISKSQLPHPFGACGKCRCSSNITVMFVSLPMRVRRFTWLWVQFSTVQLSRYQWVWK